MSAIVVHSKIHTMFLILTPTLDSNLDVISVIKCFKSSKQVTDWNSKAIFVQIIMHSTES